MTQSPQAGKGLSQIILIAMAGIIILFAGFFVAKGISSDENQTNNNTAAAGSEMAPDKEWFNNSQGYDEALAQFESDENIQPMLVYFHAPWCPYCKRFNANLLTTPEVSEHLKPYLKVKVYPEENHPEDADLMNEFGATGFPTLFVRHPGDENFTRVDVYNPRTQELYSPEEFISHL